MIARELCSSTKGAQAGKVKKVELGDHTINVVQGYHPGGFLNYKRDGGKLLEELFRRLYIPCASWKSQQLVALIASVSNTLVAPTDISVTRNMETECYWNRAAER
jgi:hypothetical protein